MTARLLRAFVLMSDFELRMKINNKPDIYRVAECHHAIHDRLVNWERWCRVGKIRLVSPMSRWYRSNWRQWHEPEPNPTVDVLDAILVQKTLQKIPKVNRQALFWWHFGTIGGFRKKIFEARRHFACTDAGLKKLCDDARDMLQNRLK